MTGVSTSIPRCVAALLFATVCGAALVSLAFFIVAEEFDGLYRRERLTFFIAGALSGTACGLFVLFEDRVFGRPRPFLGGLVTYYLGVVVTWSLVLVSDGVSTPAEILEQDFGATLLGLSYTYITVAFLATVPIGMFTIPITFGLRRMVRRIASRSDPASDTMIA